MLKWLADENLNNHIVRGWLRRSPLIELARVQDVGLYGANDEAVLDWAATAGRILLTHDAATMVTYACQRIEAGLRMPGLFVVNATASPGQIIEDLILIDQTSSEQEWDSQIWFLPVKS